MLCLQSFRLGRRGSFDDTMEADWDLSEDDGVEGVTVVVLDWKSSEGEVTLGSGDQSHDEIRFLAFTLPTDKSGVEE